MSDVVKAIYGHQIEDSISRANSDENKINQLIRNIIDIYDEGEINTTLINIKLANIEELTESLSSDLEKHIQDCVIDPTLTKEGKSADAKVTGEKLTLIEKRIEDLENEIVNASILLASI